MKKISYYRDKIERLKRRDYVVPVSCEIDLTNRCQLDCRFCFFKKQREWREDIKFDRLKKFLGDYSDAGGKSITLTGGGEPLLYPKVNDVISTAMDFRLKVGVVTNGVSLNKVVNKHLLSFIRVSIDSVDEESYLRVKGKNYFNRVVKNVSAALSEGAYVGLSYVIYGDNEGVVKNAAYMADKLGVEYIQFKPAWLNGSMYRISSQTILGLLSSGKSINTSRHLERDLLACQIAGLVGIVCSDGGFYYCCQHRGKEEYRVGSIYSDRLIDIINRRGLINPKISECPHCRYMNYVFDLNNDLNSTVIDEDRHRYFL